MLRRNSTRSANKRPLSRSRSTSSIARSSFTSRTIADVALAERDAHIAANLSYHRAHCCYRHILRTSCQCQDSRDPILRRSTSVDGRLESQFKESAKPQQSIRFAGPSAKPRRQIASRAKPIVLVDRSAVVSDEPAREIPAVNQDILGTPRTLVAPISGMATSSTLRKSKSMYNYCLSGQPTPMSDCSYIQSTLVQQDSDTQANVQIPQDHQAERLHYSIRRSLRAPKSMSYLDYRAHQNITDNAEIKRDGPLSPIHEFPRKGSFRRLKSHSSIFFRSKNRRQGSSLETPQSFRESSDNSVALSSVFSGNNFPAEKSSGIRSTARRVSRGLKYRLNRLFGRFKSTDTSENEIGVNVLHDTDSENSDQLADPLTVENASISRVPTHVPSLHAVPTNQRMQSRQGSLEYIPRSDEMVDLDQRSRITSWTDSTANTIASCDRVEDRDYQRLSVIKENGMHVSSNSQARQLGQPGQLAGHNEKSGLVIDSQRVYSALMKKLRNEISMENGMENTESSKLVAFKAVPPRQSSLDQGETWSPDIVRGVSTDDDDVFEESKEFASLRAASSSMTSNTKTQYEGNTRNVHYKAYPNTAAGDGKGLSPASKALLTETRQTQPRSRKDRKSTTSSSPNNFLFRTKSPYRRALQKSIKEQQEIRHAHALDTRYLSTLSALSLPTRCPSILESEADVRLTYAESFYSFATEELTSSLSPEVKAVADDKEDTEHARADVTTAVVTPSQGRDISLASSVEWKTWLSADISKRETSHTTAATPSAERTAGFGPSGGHVRESAEIESPADLTTKAGIAQRPTSVLLAEGNGNIIGPYSGAYLSSANLNTPQIKCPGEEETRATLEGDRKIDSHLSHSKPSIPCRSVLRTVTSFSQIENEAKKVPMKSRVLHHRRSLNNIPTWILLPQDGTNRTRCEEENKREDALASKKSTAGQRANTRPANIEPENGSPLKCKTSRTMCSPYTPVKNGAGFNRLPDTAKSEWDAQIRGSRRMVDLFLSSRRKAIQGPMSRNGSENFSAAFL